MGAQYISARSSHTVDFKATRSANTSCRRFSIPASFSARTKFRSSMVPTIAQATRGTAARNRSRSPKGSPSLRRSGS